MTTEQAPTVTKRVGSYDRITKDYPAYVIHEDGHEEYIGSRPTQHDASLLASDYIIGFYQDNHTPEKAARLIHEELAQEGRHAQAATDMGFTWVDGEHVTGVEAIGRLRWSERDQEFQTDRSIPSYDCERCGQYRTLHRTGWDAWLCNECDPDPAGMAWSDKPKHVTMLDMDDTTTFVAHKSIAKCDEYLRANPSARVAWQEAARSAPATDKGRLGHAQEREATDEETCKAHSGWPMPCGMCRCREERRYTHAQPTCPCGGAGCPCCDPSHPEAPERGWEREAAEIQAPIDMETLSATEGQIVCHWEGYLCMGCGAESEGAPCVCGVVVRSIPIGPPPCPACGAVNHSPKTCPRAALIAVTVGTCACGRPARVIVGGVLYCRECQGHMTCECAVCYSLQWCLFDGEAYICTDREACDQRQAENKNPVYSVPLSPTEALRLALRRGVFGLETKAQLEASLGAADKTHALAWSV